MSKWQDISTAPKDGTPVLLCDERTDSMRWAVWALHPDHVNYDNAHMLGWRDGTIEARGAVVGVIPTHWRPLPLPPRAERSLEEEQSDDTTIAEQRKASLTLENESLRASLALCERRAEEAESRVTFYESELVKTAMALAKITDELRALREAGK